MPYSNNHTINFVSGDYKSSKPNYALKDMIYPADMKFATKTRKLDLGSEDYGYATIEVSYTGTMNFVAIVFYDDNGEDVSVRDSLSGLFYVSNKNFFIENVILGKSVSGTKTFYVVVNTNQLNTNRFLTIEVAVGAYNPPTSSSVTLSYECPLPIYEYTTGLHTYSPFDARAGSSTLTTKLYSFTPIASWAVNTFVYLDPRLNDPALPYYYGYGNNVYKVGGDYDRAYGTVVSYTVKKKLLGKAKTTTDTDGPRLFTGNTTNSSEACVIPLMEDIGLIKQIYNVTGLTQPQLYRYYMGYDPSNKRLSNDSVFTEYSLSRSVHDPIVGSTHALKKITQGYITGYDSSLSIHLWLDSYALGGFALLNVPEWITFGTNYLGQSVTLWDKLLGPFLEQITSFMGKQVLGLALGTWFSIIGWAYLAFSLFKIFFTYTTVKIVEPCKVFLHHFTTTPYINVGSVLYRTPTPSVRNTGFFCDGVYYYQQTGTSTNASVVSKEVSCTNAILTEDPLKYTYQCSIQADNPTLVTNKQKLVVLPYTSGKPIPYCGGGTVYYNTALSQVVTNTCCDLETCNSVTISIPAALEYSCISQADAQAKAQAKLNKAVNFAQTQGVYVTPFPDSQIGTLDAYFTHELRVENTPTEVTVYYNNITPGLTVGKNLYFDSSGCNKVLDGYYAITGTTPFRKFYHTTNGTVDAIYDMTSANSTTTTTGQPILSTNKDYSSNWYLTGISTNAISMYANKIGNDRKFNPNSLYTNPAMKKGFIRTPTTKDNFQLFTNFVSTTYAEASPGAYQPLIDWITNDAFYYNRSRTISLDILESNYCNDSSIPKGFYVIGKYLGSEISTFYQVRLTVRLLTTNGAIITTIQVTTSDSDPRTFVAYNSFVPVNTPVKNIEIVSIDSPNPQNKVTYTRGTVTMCAGNTCVLNANISVVNTSNITGDNGAATATASAGTGPYIYKWSTGYEETTSGSSTHPSTLIADKQYFVVITDSTGCVKTFSFYVYNGTPDNFVADYIVFRYYWPYGDDLDTRTRMAVPDIGMDKVITPKKFCISSWCYDSDSDTDGYVGYKYPFYYPQISAPHTSTGHTNNILTWAGDNEDTSFVPGVVRTYEEVLVNVTKFKELYPSATEFTIDCRAFWYSTIVSNAAVQLTARAYKGGTVSLYIESNRNYFNVTSPTQQKFFTATPKEINARRNKTFFYDWRGPVRGERHSTFTYNVITGQGSFNSNDITTPAP